MRQSEVKGTTRKQGAHDIRQSQGTDIGTIDLFEVVRAGCLHFYGQPRGARPRKLLGMDSRYETARSRGIEDSPCLRHCESASVAEDITKFSQPGRGDCGNPSAHEKINECIRTLAVFRRNNVCAKKCLDDIEGLILMQLLNGAENLQFVWPVQAIAALCFDCCRAVSCEFAQMRPSALQKSFLRRAADRIDGRANATAIARDLFVRVAGDALLVFVRAARRKNEMGMRIDKARKNDASAEIPFLSLPRFSQPLDFMLLSNGEDAIFANEQRTIAYDAEFAQCASAARHGPAQRQQLRAAGNQPIGHGRG